MRPNDGSAQKRWTRRRAPRSSAERGTSHMLLWRAPVAGSTNVSAGSFPAARARSYVSAMRRIGSTNAGCLVTSSTRSPSRYTARPSRRLATYASPPRMSAPTLPQAANNDKPRAAMIMSGPVRRPPLAVVLVAISLLALGETAGAAMSRLKPEIQRYAATRVAANAAAHGFSGPAEYDDEVRERAIFTAEAGLSFFHLHAEGVGLRSEEHTSELQSLR